MKILRTALFALLFAAQLIACAPASAGPGFGSGFGFSKHRLPKTSVGVTPLAVTYDTTIGLGVDANGFANLPLNSGAGRYYVNASTGSDSNTCLQAKSAATPKATLTAGEACATNGLGDQILLAEGTTYSSFTMIGALGGASPSYPLVVESYNVADPTNETKLGRATGANRPVILTSGMTGGFIQGNGQASYRAFRGLKFDAQNAANVAMNVFAAGDGTVSNYTLIENDEVAQAQLSFGGNTAAPTRKGVTIRMSAFHGAWGSNRAQCLYMETTDGVAIEDSVFWHCGYKEGVSRSADPTVGGSDASGQSHAIYDQVDVTNTVARRNVMIDNSTEAVNLKGGGIIHSNLSLNNPIAANNGGGNNATIDIPFGIYSDTSFNVALGSNEVGGTAGAFGWGIHTNYGRQGLAIARYNVLARSGFTYVTFMADAPNDVITSNTSWTPPTVPANLPSYIAFTNNVGYLWATSGASFGLALSGGNLPSIHATATNNVWDDPTGGTNTNVGSVSFTNAFTEATLLAALPGAYASETTAITDWIANTSAKGWESGVPLALAGYGVTLPVASDLSADMRITAGLAISGQFIGTVPNSALTFSGLPACVTPDNGLRAWRANTSCTAGSGTFSVTETPPTGPPHTTTLPWAVYARPVLSSLTVTSNTTSPTATVSTTVGSGNLYWMISGSATPPNWANIRVGVDAGLTSAAYIFGSNAVSATGSQTINASAGHTSTALGSGATYTLHAALLDANNNPSATVSSTFTTISAWTPATVSANLAWWAEPKPANLTKLGGGTPADGDQVSSITDLSGNSIALSQGTTGHYPVYHTDGTHYWLTFSGGQSLQSSATNVAVTDGSGQHTSFATVKPSSASGVQLILDADGGANRTAQLLRSNAGTADTVAFNTIVSAFTDTGPSVGSGTVHVLSEKTSTTTTEAFVDGTGSGGSTAVSGTLQSAGSALSLGFNDNSSSAFYSGNWYGGFVYKGVMGSTDLTGAQTYMRALAP